MTRQKLIYLVAAGILNRDAVRASSKLYAELIRYLPLWPKRFFDNANELSRELSAFFLNFSTYEDFQKAIHFFNEIGKEFWVSYIQILPHIMPLPFQTAPRASGTRSGNIQRPINGPINIERETRHQHADKTQT